jgi:predicted metalloprotease with PDZ domain
MIYPPLKDESADKIEQIVTEMEPGSLIRIMLKGEKFDGSEFVKTVMLTVGDEKTGTERLAAVGIETRMEDGKTLIDNVVFSSPAEKAGIDFDQELLNIQVPTKRLPKQLMAIPAIILLAFIVLVQRSRKRKVEATAAA